MAASSDVIAQNGSPAKLHPYIIALVRWCVSCFWSTATVFLHRLITVPITPIAGIPSTKPQKRPATKDHLDPEPKVECVVLHQPEVHNLDVIFVHGLYGSLSNTWRQGEWRSKYINGPETIPLRRSNSKPSPYICDKCTALHRNNNKTDKNATKNDKKDLNDDANDNNDRGEVRNDFDSINDNDFDDCKNKCYGSGFNKLQYSKNYDDFKGNVSENDENIFGFDNDNEFTNIDEKFYKNIEKILPKDEAFVTEKFYNNTLLNQVEIISNYETQAEFVRDLFKSSCKDICTINNEINYTKDFDVNESDVEISNGDINNSIYKCKFNTNEINYNKMRDIRTDQVNCKCKLKTNQPEVCSKCNETKESITEKSIKDETIQINEVNCKCKNSNRNENECTPNDHKQPEVDCKCRSNEDRQCEVGCGCTCDLCYSPCWPKDWIKVDYPDARVISINYTSDPYLWRPLWVKEAKRLRLHERAEQMTQQLLELGVGEKPVIWVGHSKGGLFIKQIYCDAYESYLKVSQKDEDEQKDDQNVSEYIKDNEINQNNDNCKVTTVNNNNNTEIDSFNNSNNTENSINNSNYNDSVMELINNDQVNIEMINNNADNENKRKKEINERNNKLLQDFNEIDVKKIAAIENGTSDRGGEKLLSINEEETSSLHRRSKLWSNSVGFMFYSVPHRGSPLADIKTPLTARSVELLEIAKDCSLVVSLQSRWERAGSAGRAVVRSLVETRRTLMSVLWLTIVSYDSADPGTGALCGVSVDHREICKPSSRHCLLYKELSTLIRAALNRCQCEENKCEEQ